MSKKMEMEKLTMMPHSTIRCLKQYLTEDQEDLVQEWSYQIVHCPINHQSPQNH